MVGSETILIDDPLLLKTRKFQFPPVRIVLDRRGRILANSKLSIFKESSAPVLIFTEKAGHADQLPKNVEVLYLTSVPIQNILNELYKRNIHSVYVEGAQSFTMLF